MCVGAGFRRPSHTTPVGWCGARVTRRAGRRPPPIHEVLHPLPGRQDKLQFPSARRRDGEASLAGIDRWALREPTAAKEHSGAPGEGRAFQAQKSGQRTKRRLALQAQCGQDGELRLPQAVGSQLGLVQARELAGLAACGQAVAAFRSGEVEGHPPSVYWTTARTFSAGSLNQAMEGPFDGSSLR